MSRLVLKYDEPWNITDLYVSQYQHVADFRFLRFASYTDSPMRVYLEWSIDGLPPLLGTSALVESYLLGMNEYHSQDCIRVKMEFVRLRFSLVDRQAFPFKTFQFRLSGPLFQSVDLPIPLPIGIPPPVPTASLSEPIEQRGIRKILKKAKSEHHIDHRLPSLLLKGQLLYVEKTNNVGAIPPPQGNGCYTLQWEEGKIGWVASGLL